MAYRGHSISHSLPIAPARKMAGLPRFIQKKQTFEAKQGGTRYGTREISRSVSVLLLFGTENRTARLCAFGAGRGFFLLVKTPNGGNQQGGWVVGEP